MSGKRKRETFDGIFHYHCLDLQYHQKKWTHDEKRFVQSNDKMCDFVSEIVSLCVKSFAFGVERG